MEPEPPPASPAPESADAPFPEAEPAVQKTLERLWGSWEQYVEANEPIDLAIAALIGLVCALFLRVGSRLLLRRLGHLAGRDEGDTEELVYGLVQRTRSLFYVAVAVWAGLYSLQLPAGVHRAVATAVLLVVVVQVGLWGNHLAAHVVRRTVRNRRSRGEAARLTGVQALGVGLRILLWTILLLVVLARFGVNITAVVAGLGIGGVALALAVQSLLGDLIASLSIVLDKPFSVGDFLIVDDHTATVDKVGLKTTRLTALEGWELIFPNHDLVQARIANIQRMTERRLYFRFGIERDTPTARVERVTRRFRDVAHDHPRIRVDRLHFVEIAEHALMYEASLYSMDTEYPDAMENRQDLNLSFLRVLEEEGVRLAYPTRTLHFPQETEGPSLGGAGAPERGELRSGWPTRKVGDPSSPTTGSTR